MRKISLALFVAAALFVSCSNDDTTPIDTGNGQGQNDDNGNNGGDDNQGKVSIVGKWTATDIKISGEHTVSLPDIPIPVKVDISGEATKATVENVSYEFEAKPQVVVSKGVFDANVKITIKGSSTPIEQELKDQVFGSAGAWVLSEDGKQVTITDALTKKDVVMNVIELSSASLKLKGKVVKEFKYEGQTFKPELDIQAEFKR